MNKLKPFISTFKSKADELKSKRYFVLCSDFCKKIRGRFDIGLEWLAARLAKLNIKANFISLTGFVIGLLAINFLAMEHYGTALICILLNRFCDMLDGAVARHSNPTTFGVFFDAVLDYAFYAGIIFGFALANPYDNAVSATFLLFGFAASASAMLMYNSVAGKNERSSMPLSESPFYLGGALQGFETFVSLTVLCLFPALFMPLAIVLGIYCFVKAVSIVTSAYYILVIAAKPKD